MRGSPPSPPCSRTCPDRILNIRNLWSQTRFEADPDPAFQFDADPNPDPAFHFDADLDPVFHSDADPAAFTLMRIRIRLFSMIPSGPNQ